MCISIESDAHSLSCAPANLIIDLKYYINCFIYLFRYIKHITSKNSCKICCKVVAIVVLA